MNIVVLTSSRRAPGLKPGHVRVWFGAAVKVSRLVPSMVVDYAAGRALKRATSWLAPAVASCPVTLAARVAAASAPLNLLAVTEVVQAAAEASGGPSGQPVSRTPPIAA